MIRKWTYTFLIICFYHIVHTQNLVLNPSFEDTVICPRGANFVEDFLFWSNPNEGESPDSYSAYNCWPLSYQFGVPSNIFGYAHAKTGINYAGMIAHSIVPVDYNGRETLQGKLSKDLDSNISYCGGFYIQLANRTGRAVDAMGMYFDNDSTAILFPPYTPTIIDPNPYIDNPVGNFLTDTANWMLVEGSFTAVGGERFLIIGNLKDYVNTDTMTTNDTAYFYAYYYVDDVFLYEQKPVEVFQEDTTLCDTLLPVLLHFKADNAPHYTWYDASNSSVVLSDADSLVITAPSVTTSYVVRGNACGYMSFDTVTVTIVHCEPPVEIIPDVITPNGDGINDVLLIKNLQPGSRLHVYSRWGNIVYETNDYQNNWPDVQNNLSDGAYFYVFTNPQNQTQKGFIHVFN